jgi:hypothetical protein
MAMLITLFHNCIDFVFSAVKACYALLIEIFYRFSKKLSWKIYINIVYKINALWRSSSVG